MLGVEMREDRWPGVSQADVARYESIANSLRPLVEKPDPEKEWLADREWFVAVTNPNCEGRVIGEMHERGILTVAPVIRYWRVRNRVRRVTERQLMPRYVIFGIDRAKQNVVGIEGLERIVRNGDLSWARVPAAQVSILRLRALTGEFDPTSTRASAFFEWLLAKGEISVHAVVANSKKGRMERNRVSRAKGKWRKRR
jgi:hypothetical protein